MFGIDDIGAITGLIGAGTAAVGTTANAINASASNKKQFKYWKKENEILNAQWYNQQAWLEQINQQHLQQNRDYNDPKAQMQRLMNAGINPMVAQYGNITDAQQVGNGQNGQMANPGHTSPTPQVDLSAMANVGQTMAMSRKINAEAEGQEIENEREKWRDNEGLYQKAERLKVDEQQLNVDGKKLINDFTEKQTEELSQRIDIAWQKLPKELDILDAQKEEITARAINYAADTVLKKAETAAQNIINRFLPQQQQTQIEQRVAETAKIKKETEKAGYELSKEYSVDMLVDSIINPERYDGETAAVWNKDQIDAMKDYLQTVVDEVLKVRGQNIQKGNGRNILLGLILKAFAAAK